MINLKKKTILNGKLVDVYECEKCKERTRFPKVFQKIHKCKRVKK